ncbi:MoxR family ATPase [Methylobacterium sp. Leaf100]|uniref:AAA family ATPase n=1 Tax=Methylobacterium sp. Leaf100 TaxID=1736252 RepID=UPI0006FEB7A6|nr:MoxR family ATPase [Methylobacterium sp. Leaf100]KQP26500.1 hypothetical protein ASF25_21100 [Methylobacterium sp. Leaf100]
MKYKALFNPSHVQSFRTDFDAALRQPADRRDGEVYVYDAEEQVVLAVNVALATGRPLLVFGPPGSGKSSLAANIARSLGWRYYETTVTSRTQAQDLLWHYDAIRRLADAHRQGSAASPQGGSEADLHRYIEPGIFWWAFDPDSARRRGWADQQCPFPTALDPANAGGAAAVVLIDEIDKADPDLPNNLLVPIGSSSFTVVETATVVRAETPPLIIITSNGERDLPAAFLRRCIAVQLPEPNLQRLVTVATTHFGPDHDQLYRELAQKTFELAAEYRRRGLRSPSAAEYLDVVRACLKLGIAPESEVWQFLIRAALAKADSGSAV